jgi:MraZ protein
MFLGEYQHTLDPKGRVILPAVYRERLSEGLVMTVGVDKCISVHPTDDWQQVVEALRSLRPTERRERQFARVMLSSAHAETLDKQGRITIPARLREFAQLTKDVMVVGQDTKVEIWDSERWAAYRDEAMADFAVIEESFGLGSL